MFWPIPSGHDSRVLAGLFQSIGDVRRAANKRCINRNPTLVSAYIPKEHVFGVFLNHKEHEIAVDPRRLRQLKIEPARDYDF